MEAGSGFIEYCLLQYSGTVSDIHKYSEVTHKQDQRLPIIDVHSPIIAPMIGPMIALIIAPKTTNNSRSYAESRR